MQEGAGAVLGGSSTKPEQLFKYFFLPKQKFSICTASLTSFLGFFQTKNYNSAMPDAAVPQSDLNEISLYSIWPILTKHLVLVKSSIKNTHKNCIMPEQIIATISSNILTELKRYLS